MKTRLDSVMSTDIKALTMARLILHVYLVTGEAVKISEVAKSMGTNAKKINELLWDLHSDFDLVDVVVEYTNKQYPMLPSTFKKAPAVQPSRKMLIKQINNSRAIQGS